MTDQEKLDLSLNILSDAYAEKYFSEEQKANYYKKCQEMEDKMREFEREEKRIQSLN
jgi:hypothetical protein